MAPREIEQQTQDIIKYLFDEEDADDRCGSLEPDGPGGQEETFDAVLIADKLKEIADKMSNDVEFQAALSKLRKAAAEQAMVTAFTDSVDALCQLPLPQNVEVAPEMQMIQASVALSLYVKKHAPEIKVAVQRAMASFLNTRVGNWLAGQGGWNAVV